MDAADVRQEQAARAVAAELFGTQFGTAQQYVDILIDRGISWGLLGPREVSRIWSRHVLNSVAITGLVPGESAVADVGSGAGLPGLALAILRPDLRVTCIESLQRRTTFLEAAVTQLGLVDRVRVVRIRAEDFPRSDPERFDVVTSRAVAPLGRLIAWCAPLLSGAGSLVAIKGQSAQDELRRDQQALRRWKLTGEVVECRAAQDTPATFAVLARRGR